MAVVGMIETGEKVEQGRLACAVGPDQRCNRVPLDLEAADIDGLETAKSAAYVLDHENRVWLRHTRFGRDPGKR